MKPLPIDTESFVKIRTSVSQKLYVDKTAYLHRLITDPLGCCFFLARPLPTEEFNLYWTKTGRPSMLMNFMQRGDLISLDPECVKGVMESDFDVTDLVADHPCGTYVFELKVDKPAALATTQAERRHYAEPYRAAEKPVWIIGLSFDSKTHQLVDHVVEGLSEP